VTSDLRVVIDTGVAISAVLLPRSVPRQAFDLAAERGRLLVSAATLAELEEVFRRPKFDRYVTEAQRLEFLAALVQVAETVEVTEAVAACRDPKDDMFLELAVSGRASHLLSGDTDLLALHPFRGINVVTPQVFLAGLQAGDPKAAVPIEE
jgi:putative PIN family toxin of toxin-antitoxin system